MIAMAITTAVLGATVALATQLQQTFSTELDDVAMEEEGRFALDWIARILRSAGSNPYSIAISPCPEADTPFQALRLDPNGNGLQDDVRVQADINPPNGLLIGSVGDCSEEGEDVTIAHDPDTRTITKQDHANEEIVAMTEPIFNELNFTYLDSDRMVTENAAAVAYVQIRVTGQSKARDPITAQYTPSSLETEVRLRTR